MDTENAKNKNKHTETRTLQQPVIHCVSEKNVALFKATPTIVEDAFIFYLWTFFCHAPIRPRDDVAEPRQKYISG